MPVKQLGTPSGISPALRNPSEDAAMGPIESDMSPQVQFREIDWHPSAAVRHQYSPELSPTSLSPLSHVLFSKDGYFPMAPYDKHETLAPPMQQQDRSSSEVTLIDDSGIDCGTINGGYPWKCDGLPSSDSGYHSDLYTGQPMYEEHFGQVQGDTGFARPDDAFLTPWEAKENIQPQYPIGATFEQGYEFVPEYPVIGDYQNISSDSSAQPSPGVQFAGVYGDQSLALPTSPPSYAST
ncbi:hypothetical protein F5Y04DRAFT_281389 [Hypomontagnella monticulosa]|nr:hypothetical protein F5Y04DRAFT_281389 [Hypomontagnella monticulosa]